MHVKRINDWPKVGDLVIRNSSTHKKYVVVGFDTDFKRGRFGALEVDREVVILRYLGEFYASGKPGKKPFKDPYRRVDKKRFDWMVTDIVYNRKYARNHNYGYSVVAWTRQEYVRGAQGFAQLNTNVGALLGGAVLP